jgi:hypothetical protein
MLESFEKDVVVYKAINLAAERGLPFPTCDQLSELLDITGDGGPPPSSTVLIVQRLERRGHIAVRRFQRDREATILETGKQTAPAKSRAPHWREREAHRG